MTAKTSRWYMGNKVKSKNKPLENFLTAPLYGNLDPISAGAMSLKQAQDEKKLRKEIEAGQAEADQARKETEARQKELDAAKEAEAQQEAVRKKMAAQGGLQAGYTFSDSQAATGATKVFS